MELNRHLLGIADLPERVRPLKPADAILTVQLPLFLATRVLADPVGEADAASSGSLSHFQQVIPKVRLDRTLDLPNFTTEDGSVEFWNHLPRSKGA